MTQQSTDFDYIIVGSGAGGGPLAARLALGGKRVLVLEAGPNQAAEPGPAREVSQVPGYHGLSTEHPDLSWQFFVDHYDNPPAGEDPKLNTAVPNPPPAQGIFYPRASGVGGCTVHNAMITIAGPDSDWEDLADFVVDDTWRANVMRGYFERLESNEYLPRPRPIPNHWFRRQLDNLRWLFGRSVQYSRGKHGFDGWLHTSFTDFTLGLADRRLKAVLLGALKQSRRVGLDRAWTLVHRFIKGAGLDALDPNHAETQAESPEGVVAVPLAVCGPDVTMHQNSETPFVMRGRRSSPRDFLLEVQARHPDRLVIETDVLVTGVLFDPIPGGGEPRAVGVSFQKGSRLYHATKRHEGEMPPPDGTPGIYLVKESGEIVLCGGAFNTPQLLMLSGIGDDEELSKIPGANNATGCVLRGRNGQPLLDSAGALRRIHLPGVGRNLQDRYEVTLISEMADDFSLLNGATFKLPNGAPPDVHLRQWREEGRGLYTSNGAVLGIFKRSSPDLEQPDLFIFGIPLPFPGYYVGYSNVGHIHNNFTWAILKGHTRNTDGRVRLRTIDPRDTPDINFHYFNELTCPGKSADDPDLNALVEGFTFVRGILSRTRRWPLLVTAVGPRLGREIHPGTAAVPDGNVAAMKDWIRQVAWGHHACGTCRMGPAQDEYAVLDSRFSVRKVSGLRVVDASIFPKIPGYFVVTNIYMASEKAADVLLEDARYRRADAAVYPFELRDREADAIDHRRESIRLRPGEAAISAESFDSDAAMWKDDVTGLALSGGGVRSATFNLGILQAMARCRWLRRIDFLSTVSGGGYIGTFVGRWFDRLRPTSEWGGARAPMHSVPDRIERELNDAESPAIRWLRAHGNYIAPQGDGDARSDLAVFLRNILSVHFVVGALLFTFFGIANGVRYLLFDPVFAIVVLGAQPAPGEGALARWRALVDALASPWFLVAAIVLFLTVVPKIAAYWVVSQDRHGRFSGPPLTALFIVVLALLMVGLTQFNLIALGYAFLLPLTTFLYAELAWYRGRLREAAIGRGSVETQRLRTRNHLTTELGGALRLTGVLLVFAVVDTLGHFVQQWLAGNQTYVLAFAGIGGLMALLAPLMRWMANLFAGEHTSGTTTGIGGLLRNYFDAGKLAAALFVIPLVTVAFAAHAAYDGGLNLTRGGLATLFTFVLSVIFAHPKALTFVNRSSLSQVYAARLARAYLGASNPVRHRPQGANITEVVAGDDVASIREYKPFVTGGPFHLINMTVNQTVEFTSQRGNRDRQGDNLAVSCAAMTIGESWHAAWQDRAGPARQGLGQRRPTALKPLGYLQGADHPLVDAAGKAANNAEMLSLRQWVGISGAAVGPGQGQTTELGTALLFGLANLRTGYWWNSGIDETGRDGFPAITFFRRFGYVLQDFFLTQSLLISEWIARFPGPWDRFWHLSDGGFFEVLGAYELVRRRVPRMIVCDGSADPEYTMESIANLTRKARIDFDAIIEPFTADQIKKYVPPELQSLVGTLDDLCPQSTSCGLTVSRTHAALFWVGYRTAPARSSVMLYVKASLTGDETADVLNYRRAHPDFPHEATADQFFDEAQWESYRCLGDHVFSNLCGRDRWFWSIPLS
jgi:choline dehydrogenase-like flavoprotein